MEIINSDDESDNLSLYGELMSTRMGMSGTFQLPNILSPIIHEREKIIDILYVISKYNDFLISQTVVHKKETVGGGFVITFVGSDVNMTISTFPSINYARFHINTYHNDEHMTDTLMFDIYSFLVQAFESTYDSKYIEFSNYSI
jgi:hypothetical protein